MIVNHTVLDFGLVPLPPLHLCSLPLRLFDRLNLFRVSTEETLDPMTFTVKG